MSRIAEEMASLHRVAQEHAVNEELVLKIINGLKGQVEKKRVSPVVPGSRISHEIEGWRSGAELLHPTIRGRIPICSIVDALDGRPSYLIGYFVMGGGTAISSGFTDISNGRLTKKDYQQIGAKEIEILEQNGISVCCACLTTPRSAYGIVIQYTPADSEIPEATASRVSSEATAMASASSSSAPRSRSRPRAPRSRPSSDAGRVIHRLCGRENEGDIDPISLEPLKYTEYIVILECGHILSHSSYAQLRRTPTIGDKCPTCRHPIHD